MRVMGRDDLYPEKTSSKDVQGRLSTTVDIRPWTSLLDMYHPDPWHAPVTASTVFSTPDDGRRKLPKHVE